MNVEEAMRRHPAGKGIAHTPDRIQALIDAAQDEQALELANRERFDLEAWGMAPEWEARLAHPAGKGLRSERQLDDEALRLANREPWWSRRAWVEFFAGGLVGGSIVAMATGATFIADVTQGWLA